MVDHTEARPQTDAGFSELRMIEQIENFSAKLQLGLFGDVERFVRRKIKVHNSRSPQARIDSGLIAIFEGAGLREAACIEPLFRSDRTVSRYVFIAT